MSNKKYRPWKEVGRNMLLRTYHKMMEEFNNHHGYMSFDDLKKEKFSVLQIRELEDEGVIEKFARGWYWCTQCGLQKPPDYKYIEVAKVNPESVICMDSACYLHGILDKEPDVISVSTSREDRRKMELRFPIRRFYLQNVGSKDEIQTVVTGFGDYKKYSLVRSFCDCFRMKSKLDEDIYLEIVNAYRNQEQLKECLFSYAKALRAVKCVMEIDKI